MSPHACGQARCAAPRGGPRAWGRPGGARVLAALMLSIASLGAFAQSVALQGMLGGKALLIVDGAAPKTVAAGETHKGVKVISTSGDQAVVEIDGRRQTLRVGESPGSIGGSGGAPVRGSRIVM